MAAPSVFSSRLRCVRTQPDKTGVSAEIRTGDLRIGKRKLLQMHLCPCSVLWMMNLFVIGLLKDIYWYKGLIVDEVAMGLFLPVILFSAVSKILHLLHTQSIVDGI